LNGSATVDQPTNASVVQGLATALAPLGAPVIVFNAAHSGSRLLAAALGKAGVFMGGALNDSLDAVPLVPLVKYLVERHAGAFHRFPSARDEELADVVSAAIEKHLAGRPPSSRWGWKLGETVFILPVLAVVFPDARFVHIVRDGRDVAFSPFVAPKDPFWRKIYFNTDRITSWHGLGMTQRAYRSHGHLFNAVRWVNSVSLGRAYGAMLGQRYCEVRYEDLVRDMDGEMGRLLTWLGMERLASPLDWPPVHTASAGKWRKHPATEVDAAMAILEPTLTLMGYSAGGEVPKFDPALARRRRFWS
jgi:hypothetical protein